MFKQPRVPEYRENESVGKFLKALVLFLKDFCQDAWTASRNTGKGLTDFEDKAGRTYVLKSGDVMSGTLKVPTLNLEREKTADYVYLNFFKSGVEGHVGRIIFNLYDEGRRFSFIQAAEDQDNAETVFREYFRLPIAQTGLSAHKYYSILTSREPVTIAQGGTGAKTAEQARANLGTATKEELLLAAYPVGCMYLAVNSTSPASLFGGTWERLKDRFLLGAGDTYSNGATGGTAMETLTVSQIPAHDHKLSVVNPNDTGGSRSTSYIQYGYDGEENTFYTNANAMENTGGGESHNNMPPYLVVYMWKRVK